MDTIQRNRLHYAGYIIITIATGLASRTDVIPQFIYPYLGDALYATMFYFIYGYLLKSQPSHILLAFSIGTCYFIEFTQLIQIDWINTIRENKLGALVLGSGFLWSDLIAYVFGGVTGYLLETKFILRTKSH